MNNAPFEKNFSQQYKDSKHLAELKAFFEYLKVHTSTATEASIALNIYRPSACRYKSILQLENKLWELRKKRCKITGRMASTLTTNPALAPKQNIQPSLFEEVEGAEYE